MGIAKDITNHHIHDWVSAGKKILGYYCTYIPEELLHAGSILPIRIRVTGSEESDLANLYMVRFTCSFVRATLSLALKGAYNYLNCIVLCNSCDHSRRMLELFTEKIFSKENSSSKQAFYYTIPHISSQEGFEWFNNQIQLFKMEIEKRLIHKSIEDDQLIYSIEVFNENRRLFRDLYNLRTLELPKVTGSEFIQLALANTSVPKEYANIELNKILNSIKAKEGLKSDFKRIMIVGSEIDDTILFELIENSGAIVVSDLLCFGIRNSLEDVILKNGNPLENIARRIYFKLSCPRMMDDHHTRLSHLKSEIKSAKIDGVILQHLTNCDLHGCDNMLFSHELKEIGVPILKLEREHYQKDLNRLKTRIEAFIEMLD